MRSAARADPHHTGPGRSLSSGHDTDREATLLLDLEYGARATSGDSRRFLLKGGVRYGHILHWVAGPRRAAFGYRRRE